MISPTPSLKRLSVIIPAFNERSTIRTLIARVLLADLPVEQLEMVVVDDGSDDGSTEILQHLAEHPYDTLKAEFACLGRHDLPKQLERAHIQVLHHSENRGKGASIRTAIPHLSGDITVIQDADLEYNPIDIRRLLVPFAEGKADVVYGSRFQGYPRRVLYFWHAVGNRLLTTMSNVLTGLNLTDLHTGYKAFRTEVLKSLRLGADGFGFEVEVTAKVARLNLRVYEVPVSYAGRSYLEGKKVRWWHGVVAAVNILRFALLPGRSLRADQVQTETLEDLSRLTALTEHIYHCLRSMLGRRILEIGCGTGTFTSLLIHHGDVVASDIAPDTPARLQARFGVRGNLQARVWDVSAPYPEVPYLSDNESFDTVVCINVLEHIDDDSAALINMHRCLAPGGRLLLLVPQGMWLYGPFDREIGHHRRYTKKGLSTLLEGTGFDVGRMFYFNALGVPGWWFNARILKRAYLPRGMLGVYDLISPLCLGLERLFPPPVGLSLIIEANKPATLDPAVNIQEAPTANSAVGIGGL